MTLLSPDEIAQLMDGNLRESETGFRAALLPSPAVQNHAAFLSRRNGTLDCLWFGGSLEGKSDISIYRSTLTNDTWSPPEQISDDPDRSEQNPVQFTSPDGKILILHTAQPGGNQDECQLLLREDGQPPRHLDLPTGTFVRAPIHVRSDGHWLLPLFRCVTRPGQRWTGSHDTAALAISQDKGYTWRQIDVPDSTGCVHMTLVDLSGNRLAAFFRRRQSDFIHQTESDDGGESWTVPVATDVPNNNSSLSAIRLRDGRIAIACNPVNADMSTDRRESLYDELGGNDDRPGARGGCNPIWGVPRAPMTIVLSGDEGRSFPHHILVEDGPGTCLTNNSVDGLNQEMSYPSMLQREDGSIDLAYTYHRRAIKHVHLPLERLE